MTDRLPAIDLPNMVAALRSERTEMLDFTRSLTDDEWRAPSAAAGWSIADVVGHIAATAHNFYAPSLEILRTKDLEASNEGPVERRRSWTRERVMTEYEKSSRRAISLVNAIRRSPAARLRFSLAELGRYPIGLMISGALVFDHHTHLRHDMAPALGRPVPATDADRMRAVLTWMTAVLSNQVAHAPVDGLDAHIALTLTGPGGGTWWIDEAGVLTPFDGNVAAHITAPALTFPDWGTQRSSWRESDVTVTGDAQLAARFLDAVTSSDQEGTPSARPTPAPDRWPTTHSGVARRTGLSRPRRSLGAIWRLPHTTAFHCHRRRRALAGA
jgi:uncharacterized protein (TIGR03083 family)